MSKGWHGESLRHSLASRGIKTVSDFLELKEKYTYDPTEGDDYFYRAIPVKLDKNVIEPRESTKEAVDEDGNLIISFPTGNRPQYHSEQEKSSCFSETIGGAVIGAMTGEFDFRTGDFYIYRTRKKEPDVDLRDQTVDDFAVIDEVRFKRPVEVEYIGDINIDETDEKHIGRCYYHTVTEEEVEDLRREFKKKGIGEEKIKELVPPEGYQAMGVNAERLKYYRNAISWQVVEGE